MRRRIVIGLLGLVAIGVLVFMVSQPKKGTVEWHKKEYLALNDRLAGRSWRDSVSRFCGRVWQVNIFRMSREQNHALWDRFERHEKALIDLGFLECRTLSFHSYMTHSFGEMVVLPRHEGMSPYARKTYGTSAGQVVVIGMPEDMPKWEKRIREVERMEQRLIDEAREAEKGRAPPKLE